MSDDDWLGSWMSDVDEEPRIESDAMLSRLRRGMFAASDVEVRVGKYRELEEIGRGGMSIVYRARDEALERTVVLKLLRRATATNTRRLRREAAAMASLSHPHVVQVLEIGRHRDETFVVMELVEGRDAARWLAEAPRPWREVLEVFLEAGEGLAAVHAAGLVHRDFKPSNVLVGDDGRTRVTDFGLADRIASQPAAPPSATLERDQGSTTATGTTVGTPRYMAPEQREGSTVGFSADQWSFAASLWEALYGRHPLEGDDGELDPSRTTPDRPGPSTVPAAVRRVLTRALSHAPADRHPSMKVMLGQLRRAATVHRRRRAVATAVGLGALLVVVQQWPSPSSATSPCDPTEHSAALWSPGVRARIERTFAATEQPYAARAFAEVDTRLGAWIDAWNTTYRGACEASHASAEDPLETDARLSCLRGALTELGGVLEVLGQTDRSSVATAGRATGALPSYDHCMDPRGTDSIDPATRVAHEERMARGRARLRAMRYDDALRIATEALEVTEDPLLRADAELLQGAALKGRGDLDEARVAYRAAYQAASAEHDARFSARAALAMLVISVRRVEQEEAESWIRHARTWIERTERDEERAELERELVMATASLRHDQQRLDEALELVERAWALYHHDETQPDVFRLFNLRGLIHTDRGELDQAEHWLQRSYEVARAQLGDGHPNLSTPRQNLGNVYWHRGDLEGAERVYRDVLVLLDASLGSEHPRTALALMNVGLLADVQGHHEEAMRRLEDAIAALEASYGPEHVETALGYVNLGATLLAMRQWERVASVSRRALEIYEQHSLAEHPRALDALHHLAVATSNRGRYAEALVLLEREHSSFVRLRGPTHPSVSGVLLDRATVLRHLGEYPRAEEVAREALTNLEAMEEPAQSELRRAHVNVALAAAHRGHFDDAVVHAERARAIPTPSRAAQGHAAVALARGLLGLGRDRPRVLALVAEARESYENAGPEGVEELASLEEWTQDL